MSPAAIRSKVDLPEPERPRRPRISPARIDMSMPSRTVSSAPSRFANAMLTFRRSIMALASSAKVRPHSIEPRSAFRVGVERPPQQAVGGNHEHRHDRDAKSDPRIIAGLSHLRDVGAQAQPIEFRWAPAHHL